MFFHYNVFSLQYFFLGKITREQSADSLDEFGVRCVKLVKEVNILYCLFSAVKYTPWKRLFYIRGSS